MNTLSRYSLDIWNSPYHLDVLSFRGEEHLSETFSYTVDVTCPEPDIGAAQMLRQFTCFTLGTPFQPERVVYNASCTALSVTFSACRPPPTKPFTGSGLGTLHLA
ncbi:Rhs element Vgr protein (plasmid) [Rahnella aquatilis HX2]|nr:Rhs element Vgr protein [Rahnella aquatilis HX2]